MNSQRYQIFFPSSAIVPSPPLKVGDLESFNWKKCEKWRIGGGRSCDPKDTPNSPPPPPPPNGATQSWESPGNFKKLVNSLYKPTTALPVHYKSSFITMDIRSLRNVHCLTLLIPLLSVKYPGLKEMTQYPHQWTARRGRMLAMIGPSVIMRIPHSHSSPLLKFHQLHCQKIQRLLKSLAEKVPLREKSWSSSHTCKRNTHG